ncbi:MAG: hypothetical protein WKF84_20985 [Pyrinomonadaceae bacterium]
MVIELNGWALEWWEEQLRQDTDEAQAARRVFTKARHHRPDHFQFSILATLRIAGDALSPQSYSARGASMSEIEISGLVVKKDRGGFYDRFRGRVIFPVMDVRGTARGLRRAHVDAGR